LKGGFGVRPSKDRQGLFLVFDGEAAADAFIDRFGRRRRLPRPCPRAVRDHQAAGHLLPWQVERHQRGVTAAAPTSGPLAALTRASIRLPKAATFWRLAPPATQRRWSGAWLPPGRGPGRGALLRQATFSVWDSVAAMDAYARSGAHGGGIRVRARGLLQRDHVRALCAADDARRLEGRAPWLNAAPPRRHTA
jgi:hypothetical protein